MFLNQPWTLGFFEKALWVIEILFILAVVLQGPLDWAERRRRLSVSTCLVAILMAWILRLAYGFVLMAGGFWYFVSDDPCRWSMARGWAADPFLTTWDGVWVGGSFYLHGFMMKFINDPLLASKFVSVLVCLFPLIGCFIYVQGLFRNRWVSSAAVLLQAPLWFFILLGTGTMAEMPMTGFLLGGAGFTLLGLQEGRLGRRRLYLLSAIACFNIATTFHYVAWMMLAAVLLVLLGVAIFGRDRRFGFLHWLAFAALSTLYCDAWFIGCWVRFGQPLAFMENQISANLKYMDFVPLAKRLGNYPWFLGYSLSALLPLTAFGWLWALTSRRAWTGRVRLAFLAIVICLSIMVATAVKGSTNGTPYRSLTPLTAALMPMALAPLCLSRRELDGSDSGAAPQPSGRPPVRSRALFAALPCLLLLALYPADNHKKTLSRQRVEGPIRSEAVAVGAWLRQEVIDPQKLAEASLAQPIRLWLVNPEQMAIIFQTVEYLSGAPGAVIPDMTPDQPNFKLLRPGQILIADKAIAKPWLAEVLTIGCYHIYCRTEAPSTST